MSVNVEIEGKLIVKNDVNQISDTFKKREFVLFIENERNPDYSDKIKIELKQDKTDLIEVINIDETIKCQCNITGRSWTNKEGVEMFFNTIEAWRIEKMQSAQESTATANFVPQEQLPEPDPDNLPF